MKILLVYGHAPVLRELAHSMEHPDFSQTSPFTTFAALNVADLLGIVQTAFRQACPVLLNELCEAFHKEAKAEGADLLIIIPETDETLANSTRLHLDAWGRSKISHDTKYTTLHLAVEGYEHTGSPEETPVFCTPWTATQAVANSIRRWDIAHEKSIKHRLAEYVERWRAAGRPDTAADFSAITPQIPLREVVAFCYGEDVAENSPHLASHTIAAFKEMDKARTAENTRLFSPLPEVGSLQDEQVFHFEEDSSIREDWKARALQHLLRHKDRIVAAPGPKLDMAYHTVFNFYIPEEIKNIYWNQWHLLASEIAQHKMGRHPAGYGLSNVIWTPETSVLSYQQSDSCD